MGTIDIIAPIADFFSFSTDMFESEGAANCILKDMSGRQKLMLDLIPAIAYALELTLVLASINIWKSYKAKKEFDAQADLEEIEREDQHHQNHHSDSSFSGEGHGHTHLHSTDAQEHEEEEENNDDNKEDENGGDEVKKLKKKKTIL